MKRFRGISILVAVAMLTLLFAGMAFASTENSVSRVPTFDVDTNTEISLGSLTIMEPEDFVNTFEAGTSITVTLPSGVDLVDNGDYVDVMVADAAGNWGAQVAEVDEHLYVTVTKSNDQTLNIDFSGNPAREKIMVKFPVEFDDPDAGDINAVVDDLDTSITGGTYVVGRAIDSNCTVTVTDEETIGEETAALGTIKIAENAVNAMGEGLVAVKVKLPKDISWAAVMDNHTTSYTFTGGLSGSTIDNVVMSNNDRDMTLLINLNDNRTQRGNLEIECNVTVDGDADFGDIEVNVDAASSGEYEEAEVDSTDVVIGTYSDWGVKVYADDTVETLVAGQLDQDLTTLKVDEGIAGSLNDGRTFTVEFPDYVRIQEVDYNGDRTDFDTVSIDDNDYSEFNADVNESDGDGYEMELDFTVSIAADAPAGDLVVKISGSAGAEGEVVLGKIVKPITVEADLSDIVIGDKEQSTGKIVITEGAKEAIMEGDLTITLPEGVKWASTPKVEVTEGNLDVDESDVDLEDDNYDDNVLSINIDGESSKASIITISDIKLTVDRTVPFGGIVAKFAGSALRENYQDFDNLGDYDTDEDAMEAGMFDTSTVVKVAIANLTTPAVDNSGTFFIGSTVYSQNGSMKVMDAAPYIKSDRTYVPVRYLAYMLGVTEDSVKYDEATKTVTIKKGDKELQMVIGSTSIMVNGDAKTMDVAPEITADRTFLPARYVAEGLGYTVGWNPATQSVVISK